MLFRRGKIIIAILMLLTFVGQAVAYNVAPCSMPASSVESSLQIADVHIHSDASSQNVERTHPTEHSDHNNKLVCEDDCCCPMSSCFGLTITTALSGLNDSYPWVQKINQPQNLITNLITTSLYRPPILS